MAWNIKKDQGANNAGKVLKVGLDGLVSPQDLPVVEASQVNGRLTIDGVDVLIYDDSSIRGALSGQVLAYVVDELTDITYSEVNEENGDLEEVTVIEGVNLQNLRIGYDIYIKDLAVKDYWVSAVEKSGETITSVTLSVLPTKIDLSVKQDVIDDLAEIRSNASHGEEAYQALDSKEGVISDLETIRSGAAAGATALQSLRINNQEISPNVNHSISFTIPTQASDISALSDTTTISLDVDTTTFVVTAALKDQNNNVLSSDTIDLPLESVVVDGSYNNSTKIITLTLKNGTTVPIPIADLIGGLQSQIDSNHMLSASLVSGLATVATTGSYTDLQNVPADEIKKLGNLEASSDLYNTTLADAGWPKFAHATLTASSQETIDAGKNVPFYGDTFFINGRRSSDNSYGYVVISSEKIYWFNVNSTTGKITCESMAPEKVSDLVNDVNGNILNDEALGSLKQVSYAPEESLIWSSDDDTVATVDSSGLVTAITEGATTIRVRDISGRHTECNLTVMPAEQPRMLRGMLRGSAPQASWSKITSSSDLTVGSIVALVYENGSQELSDITSIGSGIAYSGSPSGVYELVVETGIESGSFAFKHGDNKYLAYTSTGNNLNTSDTKNTKASWTIQFDEGNGITRIINDDTLNQSASDQRVLWWNITSPRFACYKNKSEGAQYSMPQLYKKTIINGEVDAPTISKSENIISWSAVEHAIGYQYELSGSSGTSEVNIGTSTSINTSLLGLGIGSYSIRVKALGNSEENYNDSNYSDAIAFSIDELTTITSVTVSPASTSGVNYNSTIDNLLEFTATVAGTGDYISTVNWSSSDETKAVIESIDTEHNKAYVRIGSVPGEVTITARSTMEGYENITGSGVIVVDPTPVESIEIDPSTELTMTVGLTLPTGCFVLPSYASDRSVSWTSSDDEIAYVENGLWIHAISAGTATITVTANDGSGVSDSIEITIVEPDGSLYLNKPTLTLRVGDTFKLICYRQAPNSVSGEASAAFGRGNTVEDNGSIALGTGLASASDDQVIVGAYNEGSNARFVVGAGTSDADRFNAFEVTSAGKAIAGASTVAGDSNKTLVTKDYVDDKVADIFGTGEIAAAYDTIKEVADFLDEHDDAIATIASKQDAIDVDHKLSASLVSGLSTVATTGAYSDLSGTPTLFSGSYNDLTDKPTIPAAQVNADWNAVSGVAEILNKPSLATVATTGAYSDLTGTPTIPTVPTDVSAFTNDAGYLTSSDISGLVGGTKLYSHFLYFTINDLNYYFRITSNREEKYTTVDQLRIDYSNGKIVNVLRNYTSNKMSNCLVMLDIVTSPSVVITWTFVSFSGTSSSNIDGITGQITALGDDTVTPL